MHSTHKVAFSSLVVVIIFVLVSAIEFSKAPRHVKAVDRVQSQTTETTVTTNYAEQQNMLRMEASYRNLPLSFEPNRGQTDRQVKFFSRSGNRTLWLTSNEAVLAVGRLSRSQERRAGAVAQASDRSLAVLRMEFRDANRNSKIAGEDKLPGIVNYFAGSKDQWRTGIPTYARVRYRSLYPGIDLVFYGNNRELEYDLVVSPGGDPRQIRLAIDGAQKIRIDAAGNLVLDTSAGEVIQHKTRIYQRKGTKLVAVSGDYAITGKNEVGFRLGNYDPHLPVVIDPVLRYSSSLGGDGTDMGNAIAVDSSNRAVVVGTNCSSNFPVTAGHTSPKPCSAFISKFDFTGSRLLFSTLLGEDAFGEGVALDSAGNIYVTGQTLANFPTTPGALQTAFGGDNDAFITKLDSTGSKLLYSTFLGGSAADHGMGIAVDREGNAYVAGFTASKSFPVTSGVFQDECRLASDGVCSSAFVTKLNSTGSRALYSTFLGGHGSQIANGIAIDLAGHAFVTGSTTASDFPTTTGTAQPVFGGDRDGFVTELSSSGSHLNYSTFLGGGDLDQGEAIALDSLENAYVTGMTRSLDFPVRNAFQPHCATVNRICNNPVVTKLSSSGRLLYSTYLGSEGSATGIAVTPGGQAFIAGFTASESFPTTSNVFQRVFAGGNDVFLVKFSPTGKFIYGSYLGGNGFDVQPSIALDRDTNAYLTGATGELNPATPSSFPVTPGAFQQHPSGGLTDAFVAKVVPLCALNTVNRSVTICSPSSGSTVRSPLRIIAGTTDVTPVKLTQVYLDGKKIYEARLSAINVGLPIPSGTHRLTVQALDTESVFFKKSISINVSPQ